MHRRIFRACLLLAAMLAAAPRAQADFIAVDDMESYSLGALNGQNSGVGFLTAYTAVATVTVFNKNLNYSNNEVMVDGGSNCVCVTNPDASPAFYRQFVAATNDAVYLSFLFQTPTADGTAEDFLSFGFNNGAGETTAGVVHRLNGNSTDHYFAIRIAQNNEIKVNLGTTTNQTYFLVFKLRKTVPGAGNNFNELSLYVNPSTTNEPSTPTIITTNSRYASVNYLAGRIALSEAGDTYYLDQFRVTTTYGDAVKPLQQASQVILPQISPVGGLFTNAVTATITCATPGSTLRYTTDGSVPTSSAGTLYTGPLTFTNAVWLQAVGFKDGMLASSIASARFAPDVDLVAAEDFESYPVGSLSGQNGGSGFLIPWTVDTNGLSIVSRSMAYTNGGVRLSGGSRAMRVFSDTATSLLDREFTVQSGNTLYLSVLFESSMPYSGHTDDFIDMGYQTVAGSQPLVGWLQRANAAGNGFGFGIRWSQVNDVKAPFNTTSNQVYLLVLKLRKTTPGTGNNFNELSLFANPGTTNEPATPTLVTNVSQQASYGRLALRSANMDAGDSFYIDNIRIGRTYAAVVPAPPLNPVSAIFFR